jgi:hypothetical protein
LARSILSFELECKSAEVGEDNVVPHLLPLKRRPVMLNEVQGLHGLLHRRHAGGTPVVRVDVGD